MGFYAGLDGKESACNAGHMVPFLGRENYLEKEMTTHSSTLAWEIPYTEEPGRLQFKGWILCSFPDGSAENNLPANADLIPGLGRPPGGGNGTHSSTLAWEIPWTEEPGGLQSMGLQRVRHD